MENKCCGTFFTAWQAELKDRPEQYSLRHVPTNQRWLNPAAQKWWGIKSPMNDWDDAVRWIFHEDAPKLEHAHSLALKCGGCHLSKVRAKIQPHKLTEVKCVHVADTCNCPCKNRCSVIVTLILPDERPV